MARIWCTNRFGVHAASSSLLGDGKLGSSTAPYDDCNLGLKVGDDRDLVLANRRQLVAAIGVDEIYFMDQIHSAVMVKADQSSREALCDGIYLMREEWNENLALAVQAADCVPLIITSDSLIAAVHVGRDGFIAGMTEAALDAIACQINLASAKALIGPSICGDCYPNSVEIFELCQARYPSSVYSANLRKIDVASGLISVLESRGLRWEWFGGVRECVSCDDSYFSYRRASQSGDGATGRQAMVVGW
jgi:copper oxidase (laccase) domain-containing protein